MLISDVVDVLNHELYDEILADIASAFGYGTTIQKEIDRIYQENKYCYFQKAKACSAYNDYTVTMSDIYNQVYCRRALGILLCAEEDELLVQKLIGIIKRQYPIIYSFALTYDLKKFSKIGKVLENAVPAVHKTYDSLVFYAILKLNNKDNLSSGHDRYLKSYVKAEQQGLQALSGQDNGQILYEYRIPTKMIKKGLEREYGKLRAFEDLYNSQNEYIRKQAVYMCAFFDLEKLSISRLISDITLRESDIDEIIAPYVIVNGDKYHDPKKMTDIFIYGMVIKALVKRYKECKDLFFKNNQETLFLSMQDLENKVTLLKNEIKDLNHQQEVMRREKDAYYSKYRDLSDNFDRVVNQIQHMFDAQLYDIKSSYNQLENELQKEKSNREELYRLREFFFNLHHERESSIIKPKFADYTKDHKIAVIGGTSDWRRRISQKHSNTLTLDGLNENIDISLLGTCSFVFFYTSHMNHKVYYRVISYLRTNNILFGYINHTNIELVENEMIEWIERLT